MARSGSIETVQPVRRIMKRSDSSSTAGDDNASVKSVDSTGEREKTRGPSTSRTLYDPNAKPERKGDVSEEKEKGKESSATVAGDSKEKDEGKDKVDAKARAPRDKGEENEDVKLTKEQKPRPKAEAARQREKRESSSSAPSRKRDPGSRDRKVSQEVTKRRRDDDSGGRYYDEDRDQYSGRSGENRRGISYPVQSRGRGRGVGSQRGRGRGDRWGHSRDVRDPRPMRPRDNRDLKEPRDFREQRERDEKEFRDRRESKYRDIRYSNDGQDMKDIKDKDSQKGRDDKQRTQGNENEGQKDSKVKQDLAKAEKEVRAEKPKEETLPTKREEQEKKSEMQGESTHPRPAKHEQKKSQQRNEPEKPKENADKPFEKRQEQKRNESRAEAREEQQTKGRGGFGKPPARGGERTDSYQKRFSQEYDDTQYRNRERSRGWYKDQEEEQSYKHSLDENHDRGRGRCGRGGGREDRGRGRDTRGRSDSRFGRDRGGERYERDDKERRPVVHASYPTRGGRGGRGTTRGAKRGGLTRDGRRIGSGRFADNTHTKTRKISETVDLSDDEGSETSSYTTATSASDERRDTELALKSVDVEEMLNDDKEREPKQGKPGPRIQQPRTSFKASTTRGVFNRTRKEPERPPRFQKQHEERSGVGRGRARGNGRSDFRDNGPGRGRGRGRSRTSGEREEVIIPSTEDWDEGKQADGTTDKKMPKQREDRFRDRKDGNTRRSGGDRTFNRSARPQDQDQSRERRPYQHRDGGDSKGTYRKGEPFLAERQQAKSDGSLPATRESLPAAKQSALNTDKRAVKKPELKTEKNNAYNAVDSIVTSGSEPNRAQRKNELQQKTANIMERFDLHNIAGVICIDDMTDDDSDISSTLSGFVEVTSRRAIKEQKDRQREEEEKKRRVEEKAEYARQKANQTGDGKFSKKNQSSKPPRFAKQHPAVAPSQPHSPPKPVGNLGKLAAEIVQGPPSTGASSNASSTNSTKRNSPITVERPMSPAPAPIFNAWDRPLIVTPAKQPTVATVVTVSAPDPLAVGSGKPSSSRALQKVSVIIQLTNVLSQVHASNVQ